MRRIIQYNYWFVLLVFLHSTTPAVSQSDSSGYLIGTITIKGNKKTKPSIILREIPFKSGETYPTTVLTQKFEDARRQLMNTALFHTVLVAVENYEGNKANIAVEVKERWYLFPAPYFKPVDRNLNQWLVEQKASFERVNYGAKLYYYNATGRNDKLKAIYINGYTRQLSFSYDRLYIDKQLKWGLRTSFNSGRNREINYNTIADKQAFYKNDNQFVGRFLNASAEVTYRRAIRTRHSFGVSFSRQEVVDTIIKLNPNFIQEGKKEISYPSLYYTMAYYDLDYIPYPTRGYGAEISVTKRGLSSSFSSWELYTKAAAYRSFSPKSFASLSFYAGIKAPFKQPFFNRRFLGYGDSFLQGYEYYVIDGVAGGFLKTTFNQQLFNFKVRIPPIKRGKEATYIPFRILSKVFGNAGYVYDPEPGSSLLSNRMLYSGGVGIDIVTFYDIILKFEWSFNQLGENGLYLHRKSVF